MTLLKDLKWMYCYSLYNDLGQLDFLVIQEDETTESLQIFTRCFNVFLRTMKSMMNYSFVR